MKAIGGYFGLECDLKENYPFEEYHHLNTARNAIEIVLKVINPQKVYLPYFTCDVVLEPIDKLKIPYEFYNIGFNFEPNINVNKIGDKDCIILSDYFGITTKLVRQFKKHGIKNLIIDNAQALFAQPIDEAYNIYSPRKFVGLPDGGLVYTNNKFELPNEQDQSYDRCSHLLKRIDLSAEEAYSNFQINDGLLENQPTKRMSKLTQHLLRGIDYEKIRKKRIENFNYIANALNSTNIFKINEIISSDDVPMVYPYLIENGKEVKQQLIKNKIFIATYWPNVLNWTKNRSWEYFLTENLVSLPIDQRYNEEDMNIVLNSIKRSL